MGVGGEVVVEVPAHMARRGEDAWWRARSASRPDAERSRPAAPRMIGVPTIVSGPNQRPAAAIAAYTSGTSTRENSTAL